jgi:hypothetical protein
MLLGTRTQRTIVAASYIRKHGLTTRIGVVNGWRAVVNIAALMVSATIFWLQPIAAAAFCGSELPRPRTQWNMKPKGRRGCNEIPGYGVVCNRIFDSANTVPIKDWVRVDPCMAAKRSFAVSKI